MIIDRRSFQFGIIAATLLVVAPAPAAAQSYPSRPIRLIVGFAAGGPTDVLARIIGGKMSEILGQQVVIENRTGASGNIATQFVVRAPNDGYTILMGANSNAVNESLFKNLGFNFAKDLVPVAPLAEAPTVLVVHPSLEVKSVKDLINLAKAKPGEIMYATAGKGTTTHLAGELFNLMADVKLTAVPYKGSGETTKDLLSGQIKVMFSPVPPVKALIEDGKLRGVASTGPRRSAVVPNLPTVAEEGLEGLRHADVVRPDGAGRHAGRHRRKVVEGGRRRGQVGHREGRARQAGLRSADRQPPAVRHVHQATRSKSGARSSRPSDPSSNSSGEAGHGPDHRTAENPHRAARHHGNPRRHGDRLGRCDPDGRRARAARRHLSPAGRGALSGHPVLRALCEMAAVQGRLLDRLGHHGAASTRTSPPARPTATRAGRWSTRRNGCRTAT